MHHIRMELYVQSDPTIRLYYAIFLSVPLYFVSVPFDTARLRYRLCMKCQHGIGDGRTIRFRANGYWISRIVYRVNWHRWSTIATFRICKWSQNSNNFAFVRCSSLSYRHFSFSLLTSSIHHRIIVISIRFKWYRAQCVCLYKHLIAVHIEM